MQSMQGYGTNWRAPKVDVHDFSMVPRSDVPRSAFRMQKQHKTTFSASKLIPVFLEEVLPGDSWNVSMTCFARLSTPIYPIMDNVDLESFFFFVPNRLVWTNWYKFMGEQENPSDSISFSIPQVVSGIGGFAPFSPWDYYGLPTALAGGNSVSVNALPFRGYNIIWNSWFRDENLMVGQPTGSTSGYGIVSMDNGPDPIANYTYTGGCVGVCKRHDFFTACLPWTQKGATAISLPLGTSATVKTQASDLFTGAQQSMRIGVSDGSSSFPANSLLGVDVTGTRTAVDYSSTANSLATPADKGWYPTNLYADLSTATSASINAIRLAVTTQQLLEKDARAGSRYQEIIMSHFGVRNPLPLYRPEYLGGGKSPVNISPVPQTVPNYTGGPASPIGTLSAVGTALARGHGFRQVFTEHGYIHGFVTCRQDMGYQQGLRRHWSRNTRYDYYFPVFANIGEQPVFNREIYCDGSANDIAVFGYQEAWAHYRYSPSYTSGYFRSTATTPLDTWHLVEKFAALPTLNSAFIVDSTTNQLTRVMAAGASSANQQLLCDMFFDMKVARCMPMYSVPGVPRF